MQREGLARTHIYADEWDSARETPRAELSKAEKPRSRALGSWNLPEPPEHGAQWVVFGTVSRTSARYPKRMTSSDLPVISVCVCTHNGALRIEDTLWSLICQTADAGTYEILVVDNASEDTQKLKAVIQRLEGHDPPIALIGETTIGLSHAKNRAVSASHGDYVYFIDDDALANPRLVEHYLDAISVYSPDVLGGSVLPLFATQPSDALDYRYWPRWSLKHFGDQDRWLIEGEYFLGGNQAVARQVLKANPFNPDLGRRGESWLAEKNGTWVRLPLPVGLYPALSSSTR